MAQSEACMQPIDVMGLVALVYLVALHVDIIKYTVPTRIAENLS